MSEMIETEQTDEWIIQEILNLNDQISMFDRDEESNEIRDRILSYGYDVWEKLDESTQLIVARNISVQYHTNNQNKESVKNIDLLTKWINLFELLDNQNNKVERIEVDLPSFLAKTYFNLNHHLKAKYLIQETIKKWLPRWENLDSKYRRSVIFAFQTLSIIFEDNPEFVKDQLFNYLVPLVQINENDELNTNKVKILTHACHLLIDKDYNTDAQNLLKPVIERMIFDWNALDFDVRINVFKCINTFIKKSVKNNVVNQQWDSQVDGYVETISLLLKHDINTAQSDEQMASTISCYLRLLSLNYNKKNSLFYKNLVEEVKSLLFSTKPIGDSSKYEILRIFNHSLSAAINNDEKIILANFLDNIDITDIKNASVIEEKIKIIEIIAKHAKENKNYNEAINRFNQIIDMSKSHIDEQNIKNYYTRSLRFLTEIYTITNPEMINKIFHQSIELFEQNKSLKKSSDYKYLVSLHVKNQIKSLGLLPLDEFKIKVDKIFSYVTILDDESTTHEVFDTFCRQYHFLSYKLHEYLVFRWLDELKKISISFKEGLNSLVNYLSYISSFQKYREAENFKNIINNIFKNILELINEDIEDFEKNKITNILYPIYILGAFYIDNDKSKLEKLNHFVFKTLIFKFEKPQKNQGNNNSILITSRLLLDQTIQLGGREVKDFLDITMQEMESNIEYIAHNSSGFLRTLEIYQIYYEYYQAYRLNEIFEKINLLVALKKELEPYDVNYIAKFYFDIIQSKKTEVDYAKNLEIIIQDIESLFSSKKVDGVYLTKLYLERSRTSDSTEKSILILNKAIGFLIPHIDYHSGNRTAISDLYLELANKLVSDSNIKAIKKLEESIELFEYYYKVNEKNPMPIFKLYQNLADLSQNKFPYKYKHALDSIIKDQTFQIIEYSNDNKVVFLVDFFMRIHLYSSDAYNISENHLLSHSYLLYFYESISRSGYKNQLTSSLQQSNDKDYFDIKFYDVLIKDSKCLLMDLKVTQTSWLFPKHAQLFLDLAEGLLVLEWYSPRNLLNNIVNLASIEMADNKKQVNKTSRQVARYFLRCNNWSKLEHNETNELLRLIANKDVSGKLLATIYNIYLQYDGDKDALHASLIKEIDVVTLAFEIDRIFLTFATNHKYTETYFKDIEKAKLKFPNIKTDQKLELNQHCFSEILVNELLNIDYWDQLRSIQVFLTKFSFDAQEGYGIEQIWQLYLADQLENTIQTDIKEYILATGNIGLNKLFNILPHPIQNNELLNVLKKCQHAIMPKYIDTNDVDSIWRLLEFNRLALNMRHIEQVNHDKLSTFKAKCFNIGKSLKKIYIQQQKILLDYLNTDNDESIQQQKPFAMFELLAHEFKTNQIQLQIIKPENASVILEPHQVIVQLWIQDESISVLSLAQYEQSATLGSIKLENPERLGIISHWSNVLNQVNEQISTENIESLYDQIQLLTDEILNKLYVLLQSYDWIVDDIILIPDSTLSILPWHYHPDLYQVNLIHREKHHTPKLVLEVSISSWFYKHKSDFNPDLCNSYTTSDVLQLTHGRLAKDSALVESNLINHLNFNMVDEVDNSIAMIDKLINTSRHHLIGHGFFDFNNPIESNFIVNNTQEKGLQRIKAWQIANLEISGEISLSVCQSLIQAEGKKNEIERMQVFSQNYGATGIGASFIDASVVIGSTAPIDTVASLFFNYFYQMNRWCFDAVTSMVLSQILLRNLKFQDAIQFLDYLDELLNSEDTKCPYAIQTSKLKQSIKHRSKHDDLVFSSPLYWSTYSIIGNAKPCQLKPFQMQTLIYSFYLGLLFKYQVKLSTIVSKIIPD